MFWEIFTSLCKSKGSSANGVCKELGFSNAAATKWKKGAEPSGKTLKRIADYFGVSTDYLLTGEESKKEQPPVSVLRKQLYEICESLSEEEQMELLKLGKMIRDAHALREKSSPE